MEEARGRIQSSILKSAELRFFGFVCLLLFLGSNMVPAAYN